MSRQTVFQKLIRDTNTVLRRLAAGPHQTDWTVNWGDIACRQAGASARIALNRARAGYF